MEPLTDACAEALLFRRQFLLGPRYVDSFPTWRRATVGDRFFLQAHPGLGLTQIKAEGNVELTLLGYLIDPDHPGHSDEDILERLATGLERPRDLFKRTARGRALGSYRR